MEPLAKPAIEAVRRGETKFVPERFEKIYYNWMENIRDWCISRQLWWGHRIPAWYCQDCGEVVVARTAPEVCPKCGSHHLEQDSDTLDTWFSSALWPFSTLGWPDKTPELDYFYPTNTLVTGYDIIFFWIARMIFSGIEQMGKVPFDTVLVHGLVRDAQGRKMSKSLGNGIDPLEVIDQYGTDALRFTLATGNSPGNDMRFSDDKVKASRNFVNKLWNAARFTLMNLDDSLEKPELPATLEMEDRWILSRYNSLVREVTQNLDRFELGVAVSKLYDFFWDVLCDWYIELAKIRFQAGGETSLAAQKVLVYVMTGALELLHPFMPFVTEEIWQSLPHEGPSIMVAHWPEYDPALSFEEDEREFTRIMEAVRLIRNRRSEMNVPPSRKARVYIETEMIDTFTAGIPFIKRLAGASEVEVAASQSVEGAVLIVTDSARILIPMEELIDVAAERARLEKEMAGCRKEIGQLEGKLANPGFVQKAPAAVVEADRRSLPRRRTGWRSWRTASASWAPSNERENRPDGPGDAVSAAARPRLYPAHPSGRTGVGRCFEMTYPEALDWIHSAKRYPHGNDPARMLDLLARLGNPQKKLRVIHIAGTNGKGSATAMTASVLTRAGYKTGRYVSPYVLEFRERMEIDGRMITEERLTALVERLRPVVQALGEEGRAPAEFEIVTALAFLYFAEEDCDLVCLEVGLGGRFDSTNKIDRALVSVIMAIGYDHTDILGDTLAEIAYEKAGILKEGGDPRALSRTGGGGEGGHPAGGGRPAQPGGDPRPRRHPAARCRPIASADRLAGPYDRYPLCRPASAAQYGGGAGGARAAAGAGLYDFGYSHRRGDCRHPLSCPDGAAVRSSAGAARRRAQCPGGRGVGPHAGSAGGTGPSAGRGGRHGGRQAA